MSDAERRSQLLDVTKVIVGEHGFHAVSIEAVARRAGITRPGRLVLMPPEGAPVILRERITAGRDAIVATLAEVVRLLVHADWLLGRLEP